MLFDRVMAHCQETVWNLGLSHCKHWPTHYSLLIQNKKNNVAQSAYKMHCSSYLILKGIPLRSGRMTQEKVNFWKPLFSCYQHFGASKPILLYRTLLKIVFYWLSICFNIVIYLLTWEKLTIVIHFNAINVMACKNISITNCRIHFPLFC